METERDLREGQTGARDCTVFSKKLTTKTASRQVFLAGLSFGSTIVGKFQLARSCILQCCTD